ncbi:hypothetical protein JXO59_09125 [candidate division KSB1 bacterium]|nr:hypothetical protein [candidate division KSB1 bacterium]
METEPVYYHIYCDTIPGFSPGMNNYLAATTDTEYVHTDPRLADPNTDLFYIVKAVDFWGNQSASSDTVGETGFVLASVRIFLESPYHADGDTMSTMFRDENLLPLETPYAEAARAVTEMPVDVTDWVWLQLRDPDTHMVVAQESFLLKKDGMVTELDGVNQQLGFTGIDAGDYELIVRHRNHLAVMARPVLHFDDNTAALYDFSADSSAYYGKDATKELENGVWGLWAGDISQDGLISDDDYESWRLASQQGKTGYQEQDLNFDGIINTKDYLIWYRARLSGVAGKVP